MYDLTLIRHGQAQTGAKTEASYDSLSELGLRQAGWLGEHIKASHGFDHVISGSLNRQVQTAEGLGLDAPHTVDPRLNEMDYFGLAASLEVRAGVPWPTSEEEFSTHAPLLLTAWREGDIEDGLESYADFCNRITGALEDADKLEGRVLMVTSAGVIATLTTLSLALDVPAKAKVFMNVAHTSMHRYAVRPDGLHLTQFAATPHFDTPDRVAHKTYI
ncbi:MAG: histidine phosphatase family protein [Rhodobacteraceae bacterium]|nr:histidine phosphatase family protein [Paracoccaceae bacterium]